MARGGSPPSRRGSIALGLLTGAALLFRWVPGSSSGRGRSSSPPPAGSTSRRARGGSCDVTTNLFVNLAVVAYFETQRYSAVDLGTHDPLHYAASLVIRP